MIIGFAANEIREKTRITSEHAIFQVAQSRVTALVIDSVYNSRTTVAALGVCHSHDAIPVTF